MAKRKFTSEFKAKVALEAIKGQWTPMSRHSFPEPKVEQPIVLHAAFLRDSWPQ